MLFTRIRSAVRTVDRHPNLMFAVLQATTPYSQSQSDDYAREHCSLKSCLSASHDTQCILSAGNVNIVTYIRRTVGKPADLPLLACGFLRSGDLSVFTFTSSYYSTIYSTPYSMTSPRRHYSPNSPLSQRSYNYSIASLLLFHRFHPPISRRMAAWS